jgi:copper chaperone CopZ
MEQVTYSLPSMWADHHVLAVRQALGAVPGVGEVVASSLYKDVRIEYDPSSVGPEALEAALREAGHAPGAEPELPTVVPRIDDASDWFQMQQRVTETDKRDLEMSGDHRKY